MNKDRAEGKAKDVAGRIERQAGEWTGDTEKQVHGAAKQVEGKVQNAWGTAKDAAKKARDEAKARKATRPSDKSIETKEEQDNIRSRRKVS
jgi:uncharacterized protein YjbJ (UPF0337 family)